MRRDAKTLERDAARLIAETKATLAAHPSRPPARAKRTLPITQDQFDRTFAEQAGRVLGKRFAHEAHRLADELGIQVHHRVPSRNMQRPARPDTEIVGRIWKLDRPVVQLSDNLAGYELQRVLAHECAHHLGVDDEGLCDVFATNFLRDDAWPAWRPKLARMT
jgi:hypothetical protein